MIAEELNIPFRMWYCRRAVSMVELEEADMPPDVERNFENASFEGARIVMPCALMRAVASAGWPWIRPVGMC